MHNTENKYRTPNIKIGREITYFSFSWVITSRLSDPVWSPSKYLEPSGSTLPYAFVID